MPIKTKQFLLTIICICCGWPTAEAQYFDLKSVRYQQGDYEYAFPLFKDTSVAARKINTYLWVECLHLAPMHFQRNPFENSGLPDVGSNQGTTYIGYQIDRNDHKLFTVQINYEYTSAGLNFYSQRYYFDPSTGRVVRIHNLFTEKGEEAVLQKITANRRQRLQAYLKTLDTTANGKVAPEVYRVYAQGLEKLSHDHLDINTMHIQGNNLVLIRPSYGYTHYFKALDTAKIYKNVLSFDALQPYLSDYGKCLLSTIKKGCPLPVKYQKVYGTFFGTIDGKYPITMVFIQGPEFSPDMVYFYDKYKKLIPFQNAPRQGDEDVRLWKMGDEGMPDDEAFVLYKTIDGGWKGIWRKAEKKYPVKMH